MSRVQEHDYLTMGYFVGLKGFSPTWLLKHDLSAEHSCLVVKKIRDRSPDRDEHVRSSWDKIIGRVICFRCLGVKDQTIFFRNEAQNPLCDPKPQHKRADDVLGKT